MQGLVGGTEVVLCEQKNGRHIIDVLQLLSEFQQVRQVHICS